jgi:hypothetical protein
VNDVFSLLTGILFGWILVNSWLRASNKTVTTIAVFLIVSSALNIVSYSMVLSKGVHNLIVLSRIERLDRDTNPILFLRVGVLIFQFATLIKHLAYYVFTKRYYEIAVDMLCFDKKMKWYESKSCQNYNILFVLILVINETCSMLRSSLVLGAADADFVVALKNFDYWTINIYYFLMNLVILFCVLFVIRLIKKKPEFEGNTKILIPHFLVFFSGLVGTFMHMLTAPLFINAWSDLSTINFKFNYIILAGNFI